MALLRSISLTFAAVATALLPSCADENVRDVLDVASTPVHGLADVVSDDRHGDFLQHRGQRSI
jgi:hypothetical protein